MDLWTGQRVTIVGVIIYCAFNSLVHAGYQAYSGSSLTQLAPVYLFCGITLTAIRKSIENPAQVIPFEQWSHVVRIFAIVMGAFVVMFFGMRWYETGPVSALLFLVGRNVTQILITIFAPQILRIGW